MTNCYCSSLAPSVYADKGSPKPKCDFCLGIRKSEPVIASGDRVVRTDSPCMPGKVLRVSNGEALVIWGMDIGSGNKPQWEPLAALELDITADWYVQEQARKRAVASEG